MFDQYKTSEILDFINSVLRAGKLLEYSGLCEEAISELETRSPNIAKLYELKTKLDLKDIYV